MSKRQRYVYPTSEIPHLWAHQTQDGARNPQGNLYFRGPTIYSYRDSWPLARIYLKRGARLVLTNCERCSVTTSAHQSAVNHAVSHLPQIAVPVVDVLTIAGAVTNAPSKVREWHEANLAYLASKQARLLKEASRVMSERQVEWRAEQAAELHKAYCDYMIFFGIRRKAPALLSFAAAFERARRIENPDPVRDAKRFKAREQRGALAAATEEYRQAMLDSMRAARAARGESVYAGYRATANTPRWKAFLELNMPREDSGTNAVHEMALRTDWRLFGAFDSQRFVRQYYGRSQGPVMLRVNGDQIETSMGARVPVAAAPMVWNMVQRLRGRGWSWASDRIGKQPRIGDYPLDRIDADGTLHAGCHTIPYSELAAMARALGLEGSAS